MESPGKGNGYGMSTIREMSSSWTPLRPSSTAQGAGFAAAGGVSSMGSTTQRWHDYDTAKAAEQALRQVLGAPQTDTSDWSIGLTKQRPMSGYHTPTAMMLHSTGGDHESHRNGQQLSSASGMHTPVPPIWASGLFSPPAVGSSVPSHSHSAVPSGALTPQVPTASNILGAEHIRKTFIYPTPRHEEQGNGAELVTLNVMERLIQSTKEDVSKEDIHLTGSQLNNKKGGKQGRLRRAMRGSLDVVGALIPVATVSCIGALAGRNLWRRRRRSTKNRVINP